MKKLKDKQLINGSTRFKLVLVFIIFFVGEAKVSKKIVCYYTNWSVYRPGTAKFNPQNINPCLCTHLIYAFGGFTKDNTLKAFDKYQDIEQGGFAKFTGLKTYNKNLKTLLAIGGWNEGSSRFSSLVASAERRLKFIKNILKFLRQNNFDGLDLDWEYPSYREGGKVGDKENYAMFVQELRTELNRESTKTGRNRLLLTMAVPAGIEYIDKGYDIPKLNKYLDWFNILSYDYHSAHESFVNHHAPLFPLESDDEYSFDTELNIESTINHYIKVGADRDKLILGIPTYGRSYTLLDENDNNLGALAEGPGEQGDATREKGYLAYYEICQNLKNDGNWTVVQPNPVRMGPYAFKQNQWVGYDDENIVIKKAEYVVSKGLGGIMFWSIDNDDFRGKCNGRPYPLIEAAKEAMYEKIGSTDSQLLGERSKPTQSGSKNIINYNPENSNKEYLELTSSKRQRVMLSSQRSSSTSLKHFATTTTPEPPTTPDPGFDFKCEDEGFFSHPRDCKKYYWCLDSGPSNLGIVPHQFTCPSGLYFNPAADSCDFSRNVLCKTSPKSTTTKSSLTHQNTAKVTSSASSTMVTTKTNDIPLKTTVFKSKINTSTEVPEYEDYYDENYENYKDSASDEDKYTSQDSEEDPKVIKELIDFIKKVGGIKELEKLVQNEFETKYDNESVDDSVKSFSQGIFNNNSLISNFVVKKKTLTTLNDRFNNLQFLGQKTKSFLSDMPNQKEGEKTEYSASIVHNSRTLPQQDGVEQLTDEENFLKAKPSYITLIRTNPLSKGNIETIITDEISEEKKHSNNSSYYKGSVINQNTSHSHISNVPSSVSVSPDASHTKNLRTKSKESNRYKTLVRSNIRNLCNGTNDTFIEDINKTRTTKNTEINDDTFEFHTKDLYKTLEQKINTSIEIDVPDNKIPANHQDKITKKTFLSHTNIPSLYSYNNKTHNFMFNVDEFNGKVSNKSSISIINTSIFQPDLGTSEIPWLNQPKFYEKNETKSNEQKNNTINLGAKITVIKNNNTLVKSKGIERNNLKLLESSGVSKTANDENRLDKILRSFNFKEEVTTPIIDTIPSPKFFLRNKQRISFSNSNNKNLSKDSFSIGSNNTNSPISDDSIEHKFHDVTEYQVSSADKNFVKSKNENISNLVRNITKNYNFKDVESTVHTSQNQLNSKTKNSVNKTFVRVKGRNSSKVENHYNLDISKINKNLTEYDLFLKSYSKNNSYHDTIEYLNSSDSRTTKFLSVPNQNFTKKSKKIKIEQVNVHKNCENQFVQVSNSEILKDSRNFKTYSWRDVRIPNIRPWRTVKSDTRTFSGNPELETIRLTNDCSDDRSTRSKFSNKNVSYEQDNITKYNKNLNQNINMNSTRSNVSRYRLNNVRSDSQSVNIKNKYLNVSRNFNHSVFEFPKGSGFNLSANSSLTDILSRQKIIVDKGFNVLEGKNLNFDENQTNLKILNYVVPNNLTKSETFAPNGKVKNENKDKISKDDSLRKESEKIVNDNINEQNGFKKHIDFNDNMNLKFNVKKSKNNTDRKFKQTLSPKELNSLLSVDLKKYKSAESSHNFVNSSKLTNMKKVFSLKTNAGGIQNEIVRERNEPNFARFKERNEQQKKTNFIIDSNENNITVKEKHKTNFTLEFADNAENKLSIESNNHTDGLNKTNMSIRFFENASYNSDKSTPKILKSENTFILNFSPTKKEAETELAISIKTNDKENITNPQILNKSFSNFLTKSSGENVFTPETLNQTTNTESGAQLRDTDRSKYYEKTNTTSLELPKNKARIKHILIRKKQNLKNNHYETKIIESNVQEILRDSSNNKKLLKVIIRAKSNLTRNPEVNFSLQFKVNDSTLYPEMYFSSNNTNSQNLNSNKKFNKTSTIPVFNKKFLLEKRNNKSEEIIEDYESKYESIKNSSKKFLNLNIKGNDEFLKKFENTLNISKNSYFTDIDKSASVNNRKSKYDVLQHPFHSNQDINETDDVLDRSIYNIIQPQNNDDKVKYQSEKNISVEDFQNYSNVYNKKTHEKNNVRDNEMEVENLKKIVEHMNSKLQIKPVIYTNKRSNMLNRTLQISFLKRSKIRAENKTVQSDEILKQLDNNTLKILNNGSFIINNAFDDLVNKRKDVEYENPKILITKHLTFLKTNNQTIVNLDSLAYKTNITSLNINNSCDNPQRCNISRNSFLEHFLAMNKTNSSRYDVNNKLFFINITQLFKNTSDENGNTFQNKNAVSNSETKQINGRRARVIKLRRPISNKIQNEIKVKKEENKFKIRKNILINTKPLGTINNNTIKQSSSNGNRISNHSLTSVGKPYTTRLSYKRPMEYKTYKTKIESELMDDNKYNSDKGNLKFQNHSNIQLAKKDVEKYKINQVSSRVNQTNVDKIIKEKEDFSNTQSKIKDNFNYEFPDEYENYDRNEKEDDSKTEDMIEGAVNDVADRKYKNDYEIYDDDTFKMKNSKQQNELLILKKLRPFISNSNNMNITEANLIKHSQNHSQNSNEGAALTSKRVQTNRLTPFQNIIITTTCKPIFESITTKLFSRTPSIFKSSVANLRKYKTVSNTTEANKKDDLPLDLNVDELSRNKIIFEIKSKQHTTQKPITRYTFNISDSKNIVSNVDTSKKNETIEVLHDQYLFNSDIKHFQETTIENWNNETVRESEKPVYRKSLRPSKYSDDTPIKNIVTKFEISNEDNEAVSPKKQKLVEINRIVEISSQENILKSTGLDVGSLSYTKVKVLKAPQTYKLGEISRIRDVIPEANRNNDNIGKENIYENENLKKQLTLPEVLRSIETSTIPLEGLFKTEKYTKIIEHQDKMSVLALSLGETSFTSETEIENKKKVYEDNFTMHKHEKIYDSEKENINDTRPQIHQHIDNSDSSKNHIRPIVPLLRPESNESIPIVISIANLEKKNLNSTIKSRYTLPPTIYHVAENFSEPTVSLHTLNIVGKQNQFIKTEKLKNTRKVFVSRRRPSKPLPDLSKGIILETTTLSPKKDFKKLNTKITEYTMLGNKINTSRQLSQEHYKESDQEAKSSIYENKISKNVLVDQKANDGTVIENYTKLGEVLKIFSQNPNQKNFKNYKIKTIQTTFSEKNNTSQNVKKVQNKMKRPIHRHTRTHLPVTKKNKFEEVKKEEYIQDQMLHQKPEYHDFNENQDDKTISKNKPKVKVIMHGEGLIECLDQGNFPHPLSCHKFISCAKMENGSVKGWEYTCPKNLSYDPIGGICNWAAGLGCKT